MDPNGLLTDPRIPNIGQATIHGWQITIAIGCACGQTILAAGIPGQVIGACASCRIGYQLELLQAAPGRPAHIRLARVIMAPPEAGLVTGGAVKGD
jgi:hypothetical protein